MRRIYVSELIESIFLLKYLSEYYDSERLSKKLGFDKTTINQWGRRKTRPSMEALRALRKLGDMTLTAGQIREVTATSRMPVFYQDGIPVIKV